jgi:hypothetical protein
VNHDFTHIRRYRRPSLWRRFLWYLGADHTSLCWAVIIMASLYWAFQIAIAARAGNW